MIQNFLHRKTSKFTAALVVGLFFAQQLVYADPHLVDGTSRVSEGMLTRQMIAAESRLVSDRPMWSSLLDEAIRLKIALRARALLSEGSLALSEIQDTFQGDLHMWSDDLGVQAALLDSFLERNQIRLDLAWWGPGGDLYVPFIHISYDPDRLFAVHLFDASVEPDLAEGITVIQKEILVRNGEPVGYQIVELPSAYFGRSQGTALVHSGEASADFVVGGKFRGAGNLVSAEVVSQPSEDMVLLGSEELQEAFWSMVEQAVEIAVERRSRMSTGIRQAQERFVRRADIEQIKRSLWRTIRPQLASGVDINILSDEMLAGLMLAVYQIRERARGLEDTLDRFMGGEASERHHPTARVFERAFEVLAEEEARKAPPKRVPVLVEEEHRFDRERASGDGLSAGDGVIAASATNVYPPAQPVDIWGKDRGQVAFRYASYLNRHREQWEWIRSEILPKLASRALHEDRLRIKILIPGASTAEELARAFHESVTWLEENGYQIAKDPKDEDRWQVEINGIEMSSETAAEGSRRISGHSPFIWNPGSRGYSDTLPDHLIIEEAQAYAERVIETLNRYSQVAMNNLKIEVGDFRNGRMATLFSDPDLIIVNKTIYNWRREEAIEAVQYLDSTWPHSWLAMSVREGRKFEEAAEHHEIFAHESYYFGRPNTVSASGDGLSAGDGVEEKRGIRQSPTRVQIYLPDGTSRELPRSSAMEYHFSLDEILNPAGQRLLKDRVAARSDHLKISVIMPTHNSYEVMQRAVRNILDQLEQAQGEWAQWELELIVTVNGTNQMETVRGLQALQKEFRAGNIRLVVLHLDGYTGKPTAMNETVSYLRQRQGRGVDIIGFVDDDNWYRDGTLLKVIKPLLDPDNGVFLTGPQMQPDRKPGIFEGMWAQISSVRFSAKMHVPIGLGMFLFPETYPMIPPDTISDDGFLVNTFVQSGTDPHARMTVVQDAIAERPIETDLLRGLRRDYRVQMSHQQLKAIFGQRDGRPQRVVPMHERIGNKLRELRNAPSQLEWIREFTMRLLIQIITSTMRRIVYRVVQSRQSRAEEDPYRTGWHSFTAPRGDTTSETKRHGDRVEESDGIGTGDGVSAEPEFLLDRPKNSTPFPPPVTGINHPWNQAEVNAGHISSIFSHLGRHGHQMDTFRDEILPLLVERHRDDRTLRIAVLGSATGEEQVTILAAIIQGFEAHPEWGALEEWDVIAEGVEVDAGTAVESVRRLSSISPFVTVEDRLDGSFLEMYAERLERIMEALQTHRSWVSRSLRVRVANAHSSSVLASLKGYDAVFMNAGVGTVDERIAGRMANDLMAYHDQAFVIGTFMGVVGKEGYLENPLTQLFTHRMDLRRGNNFSELSYIISMPAWADGRETSDTGVERLLRAIFESPTGDTEDEGDEEESDRVPTGDVFGDGLSAGDGLDDLLAEQQTALGDAASRNMVEFMRWVDPPDTPSLEERTRLTNMYINLFVRRGLRYEEAEELMQDVWLKLYQTRVRYDGSTKPATYIGRVVQNAGTDLLRRKHRQMEQPLNEKMDIRDEQEHPDDRIERDQRHALLEEAIQSITAPRRRRAAELHYLEGLSYPQVAKAMELKTDGGVKSNLSIAKREIEAYILARVNRDEPVDEDERSHSEVEQGRALTIQHLQNTFEPSAPVGIPQIPLPVTTSTLAAGAASVTGEAFIGDGLQSSASLGIPHQSSYELLLGERTDPVLTSTLTATDFTVVFTTRLFEDALSLAQLEILAHRIETAASRDEIWVVVPRGRAAAGDLSVLAERYENIRLLDEPAYVAQNLEAQVSSRRLIKAGFEKDLRTLDGLEVVIPAPLAGEVIYVLNVFLAAIAKDPAVMDMTKDAASVRQLILDADRRLTGPHDETFERALEIEIDKLHATQA